MVGLASPNDRGLLDRTGVRVYGRRFYSPFFCLRACRDERKFGRPMRVDERDSLSREEQFGPCVW